MKRPDPSTNSLRRLLAHEAARIIAEESIRDYQLAKKKACARLAPKGFEALPTNSEIEFALNERLNLFSPANTQQLAEEAYDTAEEAMEFFESFAPRLTGALVRGGITDSMPVEIHLFASTFEDVTMLLIDHEIPYDLFDRRVRYSGNRQKQITGIRLQADLITVEAFVFHPDDQREAPCSPIDGRPMQRLNLNAVRLRRTNEPIDSR